MSVRKLSNGKWLCECLPSGRGGVRYRRQFATKGEAAAFERYTLDQANNKPWTAEKSDKNTLMQLIMLWYSLYGVTLVNVSSTVNKLKLICHNMGNPLAADVTPAMFSEYREKRISGRITDSDGKLISPVKLSTINNEHRLLSAVYGTLKKLGYWNSPNPLAGIPVFKTRQSELAFLTQEQIQLLLNECARAKNPDLIIIVKICLATGARWSEVEKLRDSQLQKYRITYIKTKTRKNRTVPVSEQLYNDIPKKTGRLFSNSRMAFISALKRTGIVLPEGQSTHVLRHTFASHFMMNGGNILVLRDILGHSDINMTMIYSHFAPDHLETVITKNPLHDIYQ